MVSVALDGQNFLVRGTSICVLLVKKVVSLLLLGYWGRSHVMVSCFEKVLTLAYSYDQSYPQIQSELETQA